MLLHALLANAIGAEVAASDPYFPSYHPRMHTAHNNDVNVAHPPPPPQLAAVAAEGRCCRAQGPFFFRGQYHLFMQQSFPWVKGWNGAIGWGHLVSSDLVRSPTPPYPAGRRLSGWPR